MNIQALRFTATCVSSLLPLTASALIMTGQGNKPVHDPGWPEGALAVANFESRVGWWEGPPYGGGEWQFLYRGDTEAFTEALAAFAAIRAPALDLVIHDGPHENGMLKEKVDWSFTVWVPANWHRLYNNPKTVFSANSPNFRQPVAAPRLQVYVGGGGVDWSKVEPPANIRVRDERASAFGVDLSGGSVIQAEFYDMNSGKPVSGARLIAEKVSWQAGANPHWSKEPLADVVSGADGRVRLERIPSDTIRVSVTAEGYAPRRLTQRAHARPQLLKFTVELAKAASIRGLVVDTDGQPIKGAKVRTKTEMASNGLGYDDGRHYEPTDTWSVETDDAGRFELTGLPVGYAQLFVTASGYSFNDSFTIHNVPATNITLRLGRAGGMLVKVVDKDGKPLSRFEGHELLVEVAPKDGLKPGSWGGSAQVKDDGTVASVNVPPGEYRVTSRPNPSSSNRQYAPEQIVKVEHGVPVVAKVIYE